MIESVDKILYFDSLDKWILFYRDETEHLSGICFNNKQETEFFVKELSSYFLNLSMKKSIKVFAGSLSIVFLMIEIISFLVYAPFIFLIFSNVLFFYLLILIQNNPEFKWKCSRCNKEVKFKKLKNKEFLLYCHDCIKEEEKQNGT